MEHTIERISQTGHLIIPNHPEKGAIRALINGNGVSLTNEAAQGPDHPLRHDHRGDGEIDDQQATEEQRDGGMAGY